ncbi:hypothetical protein V8D89_008664 [Ganoderma adspersum]
MPGLSLYGSIILVICVLLALAIPFFFPSRLLMTWLSWKPQWETIRNPRSGNEEVSGQQQSMVRGKIVFSLRCTCRPNFLLTSSCCQPGQISGHEPNSQHVFLPQPP